MHVPSIPQVIRRQTQPLHIVALRHYQRAIVMHLNYIDEVRPVDEISEPQRANVDSKE